jgi:hypothetical protein
MERIGAISVGPTHCFVGGRRHYNKTRQEAASRRREQVRRLLVKIPPGRGVGCRLAEALEVSKQTISRDLQALARERCPYCGGPRRTVRDEEEE